MLFVLSAGTQMCPKSTSSPALSAFFFALRFYMLTKRFATQVSGSEEEVHRRRNGASVEFQDSTVEFSWRFKILQHRRISENQA